MLEKLFKGIFDGEQQQVIGVGTFLLLVGISIVLGLVLALIYACKNKTTKSFTMTLSMLPALVCVVIMMVNGNIGAGVAVAGAFSLIRFRSTPGNCINIFGNGCWFNNGNGIYWICGFIYNHIGIVYVLFELYWTKNQRIL